LAFDARLTLYGAAGERTVTLEDFITGPGRNVLDNEILTVINLPPEKRPCGTAFGKISRLSEDLSKVNCAVKIVVSGDRCLDARIVLGAVAATPVRARKAEQVLREGKLNERAIEKAASEASGEISPIDDIRSTAAYRVRASRFLVRKLLKEAVKMCEGKING
jgi:carbon-monoxide dehydrogenase medium subunit